METPYSPPALSKTNALAVTGLVAGILGILSSCVGTVVMAFISPIVSPFCLGGGILLSLASLITAIIGLVQINRSAGAQKGKGFAITGIVLGGLGILSLCLLVILAPFLGIAGLAGLTLLGPSIGNVFSNINSSLVVP